MPTPLSWPDCRNVRDLGGLPAAGGRIRENALIRADSLERLTDEGAELVRKAGIARIVDLRNVDEAAAATHPFVGDDELYRLVPMIDPAREPERDKRAERTLADIYQSSLARNAKSIVEGVGAIADAPDGPVLVHCFAGKDRTGMVVALVLSVAGVPDELIAADYAYTEECLRGLRDSTLAGIADEGVRKTVLERMSARPETMLSMLDFARTQYGGVPLYLAAHGMSAKRIQRLRDRMRDPE